MTYINTKTGEYPVSFKQLRTRYKNTSFPSTPPHSFSDYVLVSDGPIPSFTSNQYVEQGEPIAIDDGVYQRNWVVRDYTSEEILSLEQNETNRLARIHRARRDDLLAKTDWMALSDVTITESMTVYRQALRNITTHANWPYLYDEDWPIEPIKDLQQQIEEQ